MSRFTPITLAVDWGTIVVLGIFVVSVLGSWIAGMVKTLQQHRTKQRQREQRLSGSTAAAEREAASSPAQRGVSPRQDQLRAQARQRAQLRAPEGAAGQGAGGREPQNLTMAERTARARAKEQYARRTRTLEEQRSQGGGHTPSGRGEREPTRATRQTRPPRQPSPQSRSSSRRQSGEGGEQQAGQRRAQAARARWRGAAQGPRGGGHSTPRARPGASGGRYSASTATGGGPVPGPAASAAAGAAARRRTTDVSHGVTRSEGVIQKLGGKSSAGRARSSARLSAGPSPMGALHGRSFTNRSLRDAFLMKEMFEKPIALRFPQDEQF